MEYIRIENLTFFYPDAPAAALSDVCLSVEQGDFLVLCGASGCGKSTLLRQLKPAIAPHGDRSGSIILNGKDLFYMGDRETASRISFVMQSPEDQLVTDKVWHELAFGPESFSLDPQTIRRRVAEMAAFFGIEDLYYRDVSELSGGQKQILALASVMVMQPELLLLDEPTSQLDPIAASDFLAVLARINRELGVTVILSEHRLEDVLPMASKAAVMDHGRVLCCDEPKATAMYLRDEQPILFSAMPAAMRIGSALDPQTACPLTVNEGRSFLAGYAAEHTKKPLEDEKLRTAGQVRLRAEELHFRYDPDGEDVVRGLQLTACAGQMLCILGGNGSGKSTTLKLLAGVRKPQRGSIERIGRTALLPQDPKTLFVKKTVREDLADALRADGDAGKESRIGEAATFCRINGLMDRHPYDLSGGEQQRAALAKLLLVKPDILLLDEPTKGLDAVCKRELMRILHMLLMDGVCVVMVSHDIEFCAHYADRCALFFDGSIAAEDSPRRFFAGNSFYTTAANRIARDLLPEAVTPEDVISAFGGMVPEEQEEPSTRTPESMERVREEASRASVKTPKRTLSRKTKRAIALCLLSIPISLLFSVLYLDAQQYYLMSVLILLECMLPFFLAFEGRKPTARELVTVATLCALNIAGRAVFFMLPQFKPVLAMTILSGVAFGGQTGFLVGSVTMLVSNMLFSQGPWTPWQMFATGLVGLISGILFRKKGLSGSRLMLPLFGAMMAMTVHAAISNLSTALLWGAESFSISSYIGYCAAALPFDASYAAATAVFLWLGARPVLDTLDRLKIKYGLMI